MSPTTTTTTTTGATTYPSASQTANSPTHSFSPCQTMSSLAINNQRRLGIVMPLARQERILVNGESQPTPTEECQNDLSIRQSILLNLDLDII